MSAHSAFIGVLQEVQHGWGFDCHGHWHQGLANTVSTHGMPAVYEGRPAFVHDISRGRWSSFPSFWDAVGLAALLWRSKRR